MTILVIFTIIVVAGGLIELILILRRHIAVKLVTGIFRDYAAEPAYGNKSQLSELPEPVKRYLLKALPESMRIIRAVRIRFRGYNLGNANKNWRKSTGQEYCNPVQPAVVKLVDYRLNTTIKCYQYHRNTCPPLVVPLPGISCLNLRHDALALWLASGTLYPSVFFPSPLLRWEAAGTGSARLIYQDGNKQCSMVAFFNDHNEINTIETEPVDTKAFSSFWRIHFKNYQHVYNYYIPSVVETYHVIDGQETSYMLCKIKSIEFDKPYAF